MGKDHKEIPAEAYAFLGAVAAFLVLLIVFFLYLNKKLCFSDCGGFPCIDKPTIKESSSNSGKLEDGYELDKCTNKDDKAELTTDYGTVSSTNN